VKKLLLAGLLALAPLPALADEHSLPPGTRTLLTVKRSSSPATGLALLKGCKPPLENKLVYSYGYCLGVFATWTLVIAESSDLQYIICSPKGATVDQAVMVYVKYAEDHPERLHEGYDELIYSAFLEAWPCELK